ncbi:MAG: M48 family metalloprotease [Methanothermobacter sp.]|nr:M48 family metalloprotease [Methanothermobacter sp.]
MIKEFFIGTEISPAYYGELLDFIYRYYLIPGEFTDIRKEALKIAFRALRKDGVIYGELIGGGDFKLILDYPRNLEEWAHSIYADIFTSIQVFEDVLRQHTIYFAWVEGEDIIPEKPPTRRGMASRGIFGSSMLLVYVLFFGVNIILFVILGFYAVIAILLMQLGIILLSDRIYARMGEWVLTKDNPSVHIVQFQLPEDEFRFFIKTMGEDAVVRIKREIYDASLANKRPPTCDDARSVLERHGFRCNPLYERSRTVNLYRIVERAASAFGIPVPKVVLANTMIANAAATGPGPGRGLVLVTTGLVVKLTDDEILAVIGHEMGHLVGRDPIILFSIVSAEFILRLTVLLPVVIISPILYIIVAMGVIFFVAKFFEARADLLSAMTLGKPEVLARALRKIGYQKLALEKRGSQRITGWTAWDPHPPIYFRINRLENLRDYRNIKSPLLQSAGDVIRGLKEAILHMFS